MRVLLAGWVGSTNLGDELVAAGMLRLCDAVGAEPLVLSRDPTATRSVHHRPAVGADLLTAALAAGRVGAGILGGGGLVQDETSPLNLPYHFARVAALSARAVPWAGVGLGVGPLHTKVGRRLASTLRGATRVSVRDQGSADLLAGIGVRGVEVAADLAFHLPPPSVAPDDVVTVSLRPWIGSGGHVLPVGWRRDVDTTPEWFLEAAAGQLDALAETTGLRIRFVALQTDRDHALHERVADRMRTSPDFRTPGLESVVSEIARGQLIVAMRYHALIAAVLGARPAVAIGYSPKVEALATELGNGGRCLPWDRDGLALLASSAASVLTASDQVAQARERLTLRADGNRRVLERLLEVAA